VAIDMDTGQIIWSYQGTSGDAFNMPCGWRRGPSCPKENGPDFDFGASPAIATLSNGRDVIVAGQKSGDVHCLDADTGTLIWRTKVGQGSALGGVHWGIAIAKTRVIVPVADPGFARDNYQPTPASTLSTLIPARSFGHIKPSAVALRKTSNNGAHVAAVVAIDGRRVLGSMRFLQPQPAPPI
jgi:polyvinyl alcohol dehydrogenase (cytochrome)